MTGVPVEIPQHIKAAAVERLETTHWDGDGCGTHSDVACSRCYGPAPASAAEVVDEVLTAVWPEIQAHVREQVADEIEAVMPDPTIVPDPTHSPVAQTMADQRAAVQTAAYIARNGRLNG